MRRPLTVSHGNPARPCRRLFGGDIARPCGLFRSSFLLRLLLFDGLHIDRRAVCREEGILGEAALLGDLASAAAAIGIALVGTVSAGGASTRHVGTGGCRSIFGDLSQVGLDSVDGSIDFPDSANQVLQILETRGIVPAFFENGLAQTRARRIALGLLLCKLRFQLDALTGTCGDLGSAVELAAQIIQKSHGVSFRHEWLHAPACSSAGRFLSRLP